MTVTASAAPATQPLPSGNRSKAAISSDFNTFLVMLTTQMQNQDPLNPMDSSDFAVQLATFSGVEQQVQTNDLLKGLAGQMGLMNLSDMAGWVGMEARAAAPVWFDGSPVSLDLNPAANADQAVLGVYDGSGVLVAQQAVPAEPGPLGWSGMTAAGRQLPAGAYSFRLESYAGDDLIGTTEVETYAAVMEARSEGGAVILVRKGGIEIDTASVTALRQP